MVSPTMGKCEVDRTPELKFVGEPGEELAVWEWPGEDPPFLFAHATGFHGRCWDHIIRMFPERRCLALDARGHGRSSRAQLPYHWRIFGRDLAAVAEQLGRARCRGYRPFQRRPHHGPGRGTAPAHLSRDSADGPHDLGAGTLRHCAAGRVVHAAAPQHLDVARRDV